MDQHAEKREARQAAKASGEAAGRTAGGAQASGAARTAAAHAETAGAPGIRASSTGLSIPRWFTREGVDPFDEVNWELRDAVIENERGEVIFEQRGCEFPERWSQLATNVVVSKYFRGHLGTPERETSVRQLIGRVASRVHEWGRRGGFFETPQDGERFQAELTHLLLHQKMAFNSPVWFNLGVQNTPQQASACFINSVEDTMESIMDLAKVEAMLFKGGSGTGSNLSRLRSSREKLTGGGTASGPVSFMKGFDAFAGVVKSGGKTRRAAKMVILNIDHPDIREFIESKAGEEKKAWSLIDSGYDGGFNVPGGAYDSVFFQNANHSVRVTDEFMEAAEAGKDFSTRAVQDGAVVDTLPAKDLLCEIAEAAHVCGDPGMQYDTTINRWNPVKNSGRINSSNPCSEYMFLDDTACNLASLNLARFLDENDDFCVEDFRRAVAITILAQEILVDFADYPTEAIAKNSHLYRPLGLGYANLGALLMSQGLPYDSDEGRNLAAALTSLMCGEAYRVSALAAEALAPFPHYENNRAPFLEVIGMHYEAACAVEAKGVAEELHRSQREVWAEALERGRAHGYKNAQVTVLAPTGTIAFMMDCDTTGVEPDIALVKYKKLVGGGMLKIVNRTVPSALNKLGYDEAQSRAIVSYIDEHETIEGAPGLADEHLSVFDCAFRPQHGKRSIHWMGHVRMMGAVQPFLSGAISKTVNLPADAEVEDLAKAYTTGWKLGLKALAVYRDGSKRTQPLNAGKEKPAAEAGSEEGELIPLNAAARALRKKLPDERHSVTHKFSISGHEGYLHVGLYEDGTPGEIFLRMAKEGSTISGLMDTIATMTSLALQYGVPLSTLVDKFSHTRFEPQGFTNNPEIPMAKSIPDYVFRYLGNRFLQHEAAEHQEAGEAPAADQAVVAGGATSGEHATFVNQADAPACTECGGITVRNGACYKCPNCGATSGCS